MIINSLHIEDYYILQNFDIDFSSNLSVLIGENGSGKSSVLECLAYIFGHLHKYFVLNDKTAEFIDGYRIDYTINGHTVFIESKYVSSKTNTFQPVIRIDEEVLSISQINNRYGGFKAFLPEKVILFYSGITEHFKNLHKHFEDKFIKKIIKLNNPYSLNPIKLPNDNPFMYVKKEYVSFVLLALFVLSSEEAKAILKTIGVDIDGCTTTITIKKPYWANTNKKDKEDRLWGMTGKIAIDFINGLDSHGIRKERVNDKTNEYEYEFYGSLMIQDLFSSFYNLLPNQVISFMDTLLCDDLLGEVNVTWGEGLSVDRLSEGEKQLILTVGLSLVLNKQNLLFLYDEPDVSLHPKWQQEFIASIRKGLDDESMAIITTHSPNIVSDLKNQNLHLIRKGKAVTKALKYYGRTVDNILGDYFGLESTRSKEVSSKIENLWRMIQNGKYEDHFFYEKMKELISIIGADDFEIMAMNRDILRKKNDKAK